MWARGEREASCLGGSSGDSLSGFNTAIVRATELSVIKLTTAVIPPSAQAAKPQLSLHRQPVNVMLGV